jgi:UDP-N-acetylglucosamine acyltransferase
MSANEVTLHPSATVHPQAKFDEGVWIGPNCVIGADVTIHKNTRLEANICVGGWTEIGSDCRFSPFTSVGTEPQDLGYGGEETWVRIGDRNVFREFVTIHRGTARGRALTRIGSDNYFMAYSHVAHDCRVGDGTIFLHGATLGGHVTVDDYATVGAMSGIHQFCRIGRHSFIGGGSIIVQDVLPFCRVAGQRPTRVFGPNIVGLRRRGFSRERISVLKDVFRLLFFSDLNTTQALEKIQADLPRNEDTDEIVRFVQSSQRGIIKKATDTWELE